jgi:hypothetical protein
VDTEKFQVVAVGCGNDRIRARHELAFSLQADGDEFAVLEAEVLRTTEGEAEGLFRPGADRLDGLFAVGHARSTP